MQAINQILVPTDFSEIAADSYAYALRLAEELTASVHVLHCLPAIPAMVGHGNMVSDRAPQVHQRAQERINTFVKKGKAVVRQWVNRMPQVSVSVSTYGLGEGIAIYEEGQEIDLIVVGTHGIHDGWDRFFGTNAAFLAGKVQPPILILPAGIRYRTPERVCFATDLLASDVNAAKRLGDMFAVFRPKIDFLHIHLPDRQQPPERLEAFRQSFERPRNGVKATFSIILKEEAIDGIYTYLGSYPHDLLVMVKSEREWWNRLFFSSDTKEAAGITNLPLLILGEQAGRGY